MLTRSYIYILTKYKIYMRYHIFVLFRYYI